MANVPLRRLTLTRRAGKHGSPEDQKRRDIGPPQLQSWNSAQEKGGVSANGAACYRASVRTDPAIDLEAKPEACRTTEIDQSRKLQTDKQLGPEEDGAPDQVKGNCGYGVISLFDGVLLGCANTHSEVWICTCSCNFS